MRQVAPYEVAVLLRQVAPNEAPHEASSIEHGNSAELVEKTILIAADEITKAIVAYSHVQCSNSTAEKHTYTDMCAKVGAGGCMCRKT